MVANPHGIPRPKHQLSLTLDEAKKWLSKLVIGEPVQSWLQPTFSIEQEEEALEVWFTYVVKVESHPLDFERTDGARGTAVREQRIRKDLLANEQVLFRMIRHLLHDTLQHELDESILVDGVRIYDPHGKG